MRLVPVVIAIGMASCGRHHTPPRFEPSIAPPVTAAPTLPAPATPTATPASSFAPSTPTPARTGLTESPTGSARDGGALVVSHRSVDAGTLNGDPKGLRAEQLEQVAHSAAPALQRCFDSISQLPLGTDLAVLVRFRVQPDGHATEVDVTAPTAIPTEAKACARDTIVALAFPPFGGDAVTTTLPFTYRRDPHEFAAPAEPYAPVPAP